MKKILILLILNFVTCQNYKNTSTIRSCTQQALSNSERILLVINNIRKKNGKSELFPDSELIGLAASRAYQLKNSEKLGHFDKYGDGPLDRLKRSGINREFVGENLSIQTSNSELVSEVVKKWYDLEKEKTILLSTNYNRIGTGFAMKKNDCIVVSILTN